MRFLFLGIWAVLALGASLPAAGRVALIEEVSVSADGGALRLTVRAQGALTFVRPYSFSKPLSLLIDIKSGRPSPSMVRGEAAGAAMRYDLFATGPDDSRLLIDLSHPVTFRRLYSVPPAEEGDHLYLLDFSPQGAERFALEASESLERLVKISALAHEGVDAVSEERPLLVLDPGHGGEEEGGFRSGVPQEKFLVLSFSQALKRALILEHDLDVILTRDDDRTVPLEERVALAERYGADLFISIHADAAEDSLLKGASVYTYSRSGQENGALVRSGGEAEFLQSLDGVAGFAPRLALLRSLEKRVLSKAVGRSLLEALGTTSPLLKSPHREASYLVLRSERFPSVLLELGFISNAEDAQRMMDSDWQQRTVAALAKAIGELFLCGERAVCLR